MHIPEPIKHKLVKTPLKKSHVNAKSPICFMANFRKTCPPARNKHCTIDIDINFHMIKV